MIFKNHIGSYRNIMQFQISPKRENSKETPKSSRLQFLEKFSANNFALSDAEDNTSGPLNRGGIADLPLLRTLLAIRQKSKSQVSGSDELFCFISICKFGSFKNPLATIASLSELYFRFRRFILLVKTKKVISMNYGSSRNSWKPCRWVRLDLILRWGIYTSIPTWTYSQNLLAAAETLTLKILSNGTFVKWSWRPSQPAQE